MPNFTIRMVSLLATLNMINLSPVASQPPDESKLKHIKRRFIQEKICMEKSDNCVSIVDEENEGNM